MDTDASHLTLNFFKMIINKNLWSLYCVLGILQEISQQPGEAETSSPF